ncbi:hypothetical protein PR002_g98 [Phytophthora rubi]|nr:hypothetical protein PR002_g98 [Phytophthora rubi]
MALDDDPVLSFFLFDHPGLAGGGATPRTQSKEAKPSTGKTPAVATAAPVAPLAVEFTPKAFAGLYEMDVSSLLAVYSERDTAAGPEHLHDAIGTYLSIQVTVDRPVLGGELLKRLNPLTITIGTARRLPGAVSLGIGAAWPHLPLQRYCKPVFALINFFPDQLQPSSSLAPNTQPHAVHRLLLTPGQRQSETVRWNASITLLCGRFDSLELVDAIRFGALTAEVRDRDLKQEETLARYQLKWESLYATGVDPGQLQQDSSSSILSSRSTPRSSDTSQPQTPSTTPAPATKPMDLSAVDDIARSDWRMMLANSDRLFPYGLARFRLVGITK